MKREVDDLKTLKSFISRVELPIALLDSNMCYLATSKSWKSSFGVDGQDVLGRSHYEIFPDVPEVWRAVHRRGLAGETVRSERDQFVRPDGRVEWLRWEVGPWRSDSGAVGGIYIYIEEISDLIGAKTSEQRFYNLLEAAHDAIIIVDSKGQIDVVNDQVCKWFGYSRDELIGQPIDLLIPESSRVNHGKQMDQYFKMPHPRTMGGGHLDLKARRKDGSEFPVDISLSPSKTEKGVIVTAIVRDITERKRREAELRFMTKLGESLAQSLDLEETAANAARLFVPEMADGCVLRVLDRSGYLRLAACAHRNPERQVRIHEGSSAIHHNKEMTDTLMAVFRSRKPFFVGDMDQKLRADLELMSEQQLRDSIWFRMREFGVVSLVVIPLIVNQTAIGQLTLISDESGRRFTDRDLSALEAFAGRVALSVEKARLYREAQESVKLREEVLAIVSHDLRNPVSRVELAGRLLNKVNGSGSSEIEEYSKLILHATEEMNRLIGDLLDFARIESGSLSIDKRPSSLAKICESVCEGFKIQAATKKINLKVNLSENLPEVVCDPYRIEQVLANLIGNALKFTPAGGTVEVKAGMGVDEVIVSVSDTGPGIPAERMDMVFDRYWQADETRHQGAGLGLSIAKGIVQAHDGRIWIESEVGKGSIFIFALPLSTSPTYGILRPQSKPSEQGNRKLDGLRILIVDDSPELLVLLKAILEGEGAKVCEASNVMDALDQLRLHRPEIVFSDIDMGEDSGFDLIRAIRRLRPEEGCFVPVAALTAYSSEGELQKIKDAGFTLRLSKPVIIDEIINGALTMASKRQA